jgi:hypothetical protein
MLNAGEADVLKVKVKKSSHDTYTFNVTVLHKDSGWDHYANKWEVTTLDGKVLAERILLHPHVNEQPFTRSLSGVKIPQGIESVKICAHDLVHEYGGKVVVVKIPR